MGSEPTSFSKPNFSQIILARIEHSKMSSTLTSSFMTARVAPKVGSGRTHRIVVRASAAEAGETPEPKSDFCAGLPGATAPMGNFDPFKFTEGKDENTIRRYREAELTHGRVSMLAALGFVVGENFNPLFDESIRGPAIGHFQQLPSGFWLFVLGSVGVAEFARATKGWVSPGAGQGIFKLKDDYVPGNIGFDPLGLSPTPLDDPDNVLFRERQEQELNHGRLAMFAILGEIGQELATGKELFNLEEDGILNDANCLSGTVCDILELSAP